VKAIIEGTTVGVLLGVGSSKLAVGGGRVGGGEVVVGSGVLAPQAVKSKIRRRQHGDTRR
jgi:hypothetical protein